MVLENPEVREKAEFNMAVSYLNRLNGLFYAADDAAIRLDIFAWFHVLTAIYREISTEMGQTERDRCDQEIMDMNSMVMGQFKNQRQPAMKIRPEIYMRLHAFELKLRQVMKDSGLQMKTMSDASKALFES